MKERVRAADAVPGVHYKTPRAVAGIRAYYVLAKPGAARRLVRRLTPRLSVLRTDELEELRAARASLDRGEILFVRYILWTDATGKRGRSKAYVALPPDYALRPKRRATAPVPPDLPSEEAP